jgi:hypothetical protein
MKTGLIVVFRSVGQRLGSGCQEFEISSLAFRVHHPQVSGCLRKPFRVLNEQANEKDEINLTLDSHLLVTKGQLFG